MHRAFLIFVIVSCSCAPQVQTPQPLPDAIRIATPYHPDNLDPHSLDTISSLALASHFYESLVTMDSDLKIHPALALSWGNPDLYTWVFQLRPGVRFHNGKKFTSKDVAYSFRRLMNDPSLEMSVYVRTIEDISTNGDLSVAIRTRRPISILLNKLRLISIVPEESTAAGLSSSANGTGPYRLKEWKKGESVRMTRNEDYWGKKPFIREAELLLNRSIEQAVDLIRRQEVALAQCSTKQLEAVAGRERYEILRADSLFVKYIAFNLSEASGGQPNPYSSKPLRQAIHQIIDRKSLVLQLSSYGIPATQPIPIFVLGYNSRIQLQEPTPARAMELVRKSGWEGKQLELHARTVFSEPASLVQKQLSDAGLPMVLRTVSDDEFARLRKLGKIGSYIARYACTSGDASDLLDDLLHSPDREGMMEGVDVSQFEHPVYDPKLNYGTDADHRRQNLQQMMSELMDDLVLIPLYVDQDAYAVDRLYSWKPRFDSLVLVFEIKAP